MANRSMNIVGAIALLGMMMGGLRERGDDGCHCCSVGAGVGFLVEGYQPDCLRVCGG